MRMKRALLALLLLAGCSHPRPVLYPDERLKASGEEAAKADVDLCLGEAKAYLKANPAKRVARRTGIGGFFGAALLLLPQNGFTLENFWAQFAVFMAAPAWAAGSIYAKRSKLTTPPLMIAAMQSLVAGIVFCLIGLADNETARWNWSTNAMLSLAYLIVFGSCFAYAAYIWLLHEVSPALLGTYAYINPAIAVALGWFMLGETLNGTQLAGMVVILLGVVLVSTARPRAVAAPSPRA